MRAAPGFTLLEMLVALALLGGISLAAHAAIGVAARGTAAVLRAEDRDLHLTRRMLAGWIETALPVLAARRSGAPLLFDGREDRMTFVAELPERFGTAGPHLVTLRADPHSGEGLTVAWRLLRPRGEAAESRRTLAAGVRSVRFRYWAGRAPGGAWHDRWTGRQQLPSLVEIRFESDPGAPAWPPMTIPLGVGR